jgi:hypothetical protein
MGWQFLIKMGLFGKLLSTALDIVETPIAIVKDVATLGGTLTDEKKSYTQQKLEELGDDYEDFKDELRK